MTFWLILGAITLLICGVAFFPLLKKTTSHNDTQRDSLNKAFYFERLQEVEREAREGKIDDPEQTKRELQQSLLDDIPAETAAAAKPQKTLHKGWLAALVLLVGSVSAAVYWQVGAWRDDPILSASGNRPISYFYERLKNEEQKPLDEIEMGEFALALQNELRNNPQDAESLFMLGQIGMALQNWDMALESYAKASDLQPSNLLYKQKYAEILMMSQDPKDKDKGEALIKEIIRLDHTNLGALRLLAFHLFEKEDYKMAAMTWGMVLKLMPENDPSRATIERSMQAALSMLKPEEKAGDKAAETPANSEKK